LRELGDRAAVIIALFPQAQSCAIEVTVDDVADAHRLWSAGETGQQEASFALDPGVLLRRRHLYIVADWRRVSCRCRPASAKAPSTDVTARKVA
jgi:hypothetical protein